jgi:hypothetical protein
MRVVAAELDRNIERLVIAQEPVLGRERLAAEPHRPGLRRSPSSGLFLLRRCGVAGVFMKVTSSAGRIRPTHQALQPIDIDSSHFCRRPSA